MHKIDGSIPKQNGPTIPAAATSRDEICADLLAALSIPEILPPLSIVLRDVLYAVLQVFQSTADASIVTGIDMIQSNQLNFTLIPLLACP
jgi:hypothetical protein